MRYRVVHGAEIVRRELEFRRLTGDNADSDMNRLLDALLRGDAQLVVAVAAEEAHVLRGWATCETFMGHVLMEVFVHPDYRRRGIGSILVRKLIEDTKARTSERRFEADTELADFWRQFRPDIINVTRY